MANPTGSESRSKATAKKSPKACSKMGGNGIQDWKLQMNHAELISKMIKNKNTALYSIRTNSCKAFVRIKGNLINHFKIRMKFYKNSIIINILPKKLML